MTTAPPPPTAWGRYRALFATPGIPRVVAAGLLGRLPVGMAMLVFVLVVHAGTGSFPLAGFAAALDCAATALTAPVLGRLADRGHAARLLAVTGLAQAAGMVALVTCLRAGAPAAVVLALSVATGAACPPASAVTRTVLARLTTDGHVRATGFALDAIVGEVSYVAGPALVGLVSAVWTGYAAALLSAALTVAGALGLATAPALRHGYRALPDTRPEPGRGGAWGPPREPGLRAVLLVTTLEAAAYGVLEVAIPAYADAKGVPAAGGLMFAVWSAGSIVGGLWFGGRSFPASLGRQYQILMVLNVFGFAAMLLATGLPTLGVLLFCAGLVISPTTAVESSLVTALSPAHATTEALTWSGTSIYLGFAGGSALAAAALSDPLGSAAALTDASLLATALVVAGTLLLFARGRTLAAAT
jgi:MFS family permease